MEAVIAPCVLVDVFLGGGLADCLRFFFESVDPAL
jgi:hypothetical protein